jgi:hypothetical protein
MENDQALASKQGRRSTLHQLIRIKTALSMLRILVPPWSFLHFYAVPFISSPRKDIQPDYLIWNTGDSYPDGEHGRPA